MVKFILAETRWLSTKFPDDPPNSSIRTININLDVVLEEESGDPKFLL